MDLTEARAGDGGPVDVSEELARRLPELRSKLGLDFFEGMRRHTVL